jgi:hypothetical protein
MSSLSYHGKTVEQAQWVLDYFGTPEKQDFYQSNESYIEWIEESKKIVQNNSL